MPNNLTEILSEIQSAPARFFSFDESFCSTFFFSFLLFSSRQEEKKSILQNLNEKAARENWAEKNDPIQRPHSARARWNQQRRLDSGQLHRQPVMNDSQKPDLAIQGQAMNLASPPIRPQWREAPGGTVINALNNLQIQTATSTSTKWTNSAVPVNPHQTFEVPLVKQVPIVQSTLNKAEIADCLTTGRFDEPNKKVSTRVFV